MKEEREESSPSAASKREVPRRSERDDDGEVREMTNKQVRFKHYITGGKLKETDLEVVTTNIVESWRTSGRMQGFVRIKNLYLCCDSYMRSRTKSDELLPFAPGDVLTSYGVGKVTQSGDPNFRIGDYVWGLTSWEEYTTFENTRYLYKINYPEVPLACYTSILSLPGLTAYEGLREVCSAERGDYVFISDASSIIGQLAGQFAISMGCYVVGCTTSDEKVDLLKITLGFNDAFNRNNEPDLSAAFKRCFPQGIDIFFENTNGFSINAASDSMNARCRAAVCGRNYEDFVVPLIKQNKIIWLQEEAEDIENAPAALLQAMSGENNLVVVVAHEQAGGCMSDGGGAQ